MQKIYTFKEQYILERQTRGELETNRLHNLYTKLKIVYQFISVNVFFGGWVGVYY